MNQSDTLEPWNSYKNYIFEVSVEDGITEIGESAFQDGIILKKLQFLQMLQILVQMHFIAA